MDTSISQHPIIKQLQGGLIVSCQALADEPLFGPDIMARMAQAAWQGGAVGIRANGPDDIRAIRTAVELPLIGLYKDGDSGVYITPNSRHVRAAAAAGADIIALDSTQRTRPDGEGFQHLLDVIHHECHKLALADVSTLEEGNTAEERGADMVSTTLSGYTPYSPQLDGPDLELVYKLAKRLQVPIIAEGRISTPEEVERAFDAGAFAVVVGSAITRPQWITKRFVAATHRRS